MKLHNYNNNVDDMLTDVEECYERIQNMDFSCESIIRYAFTALCSGSCKEFSTFIKGIKDDHESGVGPHAKITFEQLTAVARNKYLNQVAAGEYVKVDPM